MWIQISLPEIEIKTLTIFFITFTLSTSGTTNSSLATGFPHDKEERDCNNLNNHYNGDQQR